MPMAARVGDPTGHPGVIGPPGVPTVLIGGLPAATVGTLHICSFPPPVHPPTAIVPPGCPTRADRRPAGRPDGRHGRVRRADPHGRPDRADRRLSGRVDFVGAGWAFPLRTDATGGVALVAREREIEEAIRLILGTAPRRAADAAGVRLPDPRLRVRPGQRRPPPGRSRTTSASALERWEPRIDVDDVEVGFDARRPGMLYIDITLPRPRHQRPAQPGLPVLRHPRQRSGTASSTALRRGWLTWRCPHPTSTTARFQDLVDDAKRLVQQRCPDWTDHNVSDPGVTLIEAFAQMVDQLIYRLNRVPDLQLRQVPRADRRRAAPAGRGARRRDVLAVRAAAADRCSCAPRPRWPRRAPTSTSRSSSRRSTTSTSCPARRARRVDRAVGRDAGRTRPRALARGGFACFSGAPVPGDAC